MVDRRCEPPPYAPESEESYRVSIPQRLTVICVAVVSFLPGRPDRARRRGFCTVQTLLMLGSAPTSYNTNHFSQGSYSLYFCGGTGSFLLHVCT